MATPYTYSTKKLDIYCCVPAGQLRYMVDFAYKLQANELYLLQKMDGYKKFVERARIADVVEKIMAKWGVNMLSGRVKAIANEIRGTLKENGVPYGYVSVTCHQARTDNGIVEEIRIKLLKAGEHRLPNGMYLLNFIKCLFVLLH